MAHDRRKLRHVRRINLGPGPWRGALAACALATAGGWLVAGAPVRSSEPDVSLGLAGGLVFFAWWVAYGWARPNADNALSNVLLGAVVGAAITALAQPPWWRVTVEAAVRMSFEAGARAFVLVALAAVAEDAWRDLRAFWGPIRPDEASANGGTGEA